MLNEALLDIHSVHLGVNPEKRELLVKMAEDQRHSYSEADIRLAAALAKTAFEKADQWDSAPHMIYSQLLKNPSPTPGTQKLASVVFTCLGRVKRNQKAASAIPLTAQAWRFGRGALGAVTSATPELLKSLGFTALAAGSVAGAGLWSANRAVTGEDQKLRELEVQRDTYNQLAAEVNSELKRRGMANTPTNQAAAVEYLT